MGYLAAKTETVEIGAGILNVYSRTPGALLQTAAGLDNVSGGRAVIGLGASGPQVIEGFHGAALRQAAGPHPRGRRPAAPRPAPRGAEHDGIFKLPLPAGQGLGLGKPLKMLTKPERAARPDLGRRARRQERRGTAEFADGWLPFLFVPEKADDVWGDALAAGTAKRPDGLGPLEISAGGMVAIGEDVKGLLDFVRPMYALYVGGMGARGKNFYNDARLPVRLREGGQGDPGPLPRRQQARRRGRWCRSSGSSWQPGRPRVVRPGADRRLPGGRRHQPADRPSRPTATTRPPLVAQLKEWVGLMSRTRPARIYEQEHEDFRAHRPRLPREGGRALTTSSGRRTARSTARSGRKAGEAGLLCFDVDEEYGGAGRRRTSATTWCSPRR